MSVKRIRLGDLAGERLGSVNPLDYPDETFDLYSVPAFDSGNPDRLLGSQIGSSKQVVQPNDVLLSRIVPHIRRAWVVKPQQDYRLIASGEWIVFRDERFHPDYLRHCLVGDSFHQKFMQTVAGVGGSLLRARPSAVFEIEVPLPSFDEQKRIAAILDKADLIRRKRQQALRLTDDFLRSVFLDMFGTTETPACPRIAIGDLITFMTSGGRGWATYYAPEGSRFLRSMDVRMNYIGDSDAVFVAAPNNAEAKRTMVQADDVLLTITGSLIGRVAPVPAHLAGAFISQHVAILRLNQLLPSKFVAWALSVEEGQRQIQSLQSGQVKPGLNFDQIRKLKVPHPQEDKVRDFLTIVEVAQSKQAKAQRHASESATLFSSLQQRAFSGQL